MTVVRRLLLPLLMVLAFAAVWGMVRSGRKQLAVESFPDEGHLHVKIGSPLVVYHTDPPTSGPHALEHLRVTGMLVEAPPPELLVHGLEDGYIVVYYSDQLSQGWRSRIRTFIEGFDSHVVAVPRTQPEAVILTAWQHMLRLPRYDEQAMRDFIAQFRGNAE